MTTTSVPLTVGATAPSPAAPPPEAIGRDLAHLLRGQVRFDRHNRLLYATDASIYQVEPLGVVIPADSDDLAALLGYCAPRGVAVLPRGGGTSLAGQCTARAVVVDLSPTLRKLLAVDAAERWCHVEPGVTVDELNGLLATRGTGLFFAPDPATAAQACIGGCIGNNAAGARSIRYGRTVENVLGLEVLLSGGPRLWLERGAGRKSAVALDLARRVAEVAQRYAAAIRARFPKTHRRSAGYALDLVLQQLDAGVAAEELDLSGLICGSEGTLAVVASARLKLHPTPKFRGLAIASFATLEEAIDAVAPILNTGPSAVELLDDVVLKAAANNAVCLTYLDLLPPVNGQRPQASLYVEYQSAESQAEIEAGFARLRGVLPAAPIAPYLDAPSLAKLWALRKAGEPLLHGMSATRKPLTFVEDNAVPVENLARFVAEFKKIVAKHGTVAAYWAHASVGVLHIRPMLDLHHEDDRARLRAIAVEVADLARACGGVMSGEHGDGKVRGPLLERYFGPEVMAAFREVKAIFDPAGILNPGNIVAPGPVESITQNLRIEPAGQPLAFPPVETYFDYSDQHDFGGAVEMCSGAGVCRKTTGGTMCPSYRATLDERHSTRGRGNALRLALTGQLALGGAADGAAAPWNDPDTIETLRLCLSCKACKTECPSNVDMARLKAEYTAQRYRATGHVPLQARVFGHIRKLNRLGALLPGVANWVNGLAPVRAVLNRVLKLAPQRSLPRFESSLYRWFAGRAVPPGGADRPKVVLFADCFVTYNEPRIGIAAIGLLEALGYEVLLPKVGCCGRSMISTGLLADAIRSADGVLTALRPHVVDPQVRAIVVCEPSCLAAMQDDWLQLKLRTPLDQRRALAAKAMMVEDFVERYWTQHPRRPAVATPLPGRQVVLHGHCHQKALGGDQSSAQLLRRLVGAGLTVLPSGCCGMAGSFGYTADRYELSMKIGEQSLFGAVRAAPAEAVIAAPGTSCRHQIRDGAGRPAVHPIELAAQLLAAEA